MCPFETAVKPIFSLKIFRWVQEDQRISLACWYRKDNVTIGDAYVLMIDIDDVQQ